MAGRFNKQDLGLSAIQLAQLASEAQLMNPLSGAQHVNNSPASKALSLAYKCQQFLRDLQAILLADLRFQAFISLEDFDKLRHEILGVIGELSGDLSISEVNQIVRKIDDAIVRVLPELQGSFLGRINFNMRRALRGCWLVFFPDVLTRLRPRRMIRAYVDGLWLARHLTCSGFSQAKIKKLLLGIHQNVGMNNHHVSTILQTAIDYNLLEKLELNGNLDTAKQFQLSFSTGEDGILSTYTGPGLYAFGHLLFAYEYLTRLLFQSDIRQSHEIYIAPSMVANSALALLLAYRARQNPDQCRCIVSDQRLIVNTACKMESTESLDNFTRLSLFKYKSFQAQPSRYLRSLHLPSDLWGWMSNQLKSDLYLHPKPYVCLYLRDDGFKGEGHNGVLHLNSDRSVKAHDFLPIVHELIQNGYDVIRIGDAKQARINCQSDRYFEYSHGEHKNDLNDLYVVSQCEFVVCGGAGGAANIGDIFGKPTIFLDYPVARRGLYSPLGLVIPLIYRKEGMELSLEKILELSPNGCHDALTLQQLGISWHSAHRDHVMAVLRQFIACVKSEDFYGEASARWQETQFDHQGIRFPMKVASPV